MHYERFTDLLSTILLVAPSELNPDADLVEEFGLQSIDVVELIEKICEETGQDSKGFALGNVHTVHELYVALCTTTQDSGASAVDEAMRSWLPNDPIRSAETLIDMIQLRASHTPSQTALLFEGEEVTAGSLLADTVRVAKALKERDVSAGDRVLLVMPNSVEFFAAFFAVQRLGAIAVPLFHIIQPERVARIAEHCEPKAMILLKPLPEKVLRPLQSALEGRANPTLCTMEELLSAEVESILPECPKAHDVAMLQYTSGTTGDAKGVILTHGALLSNLRQAIPTAQFTRDDVFVSWLPVYHDMGLITMALCPLYVGATLVLLPVRLSGDAWLGAIETHRGTVTAAPDFAYRYTLRTTRNLSTYDVRSLRMALIAAEPIRAETIHEFERVLGLKGVLRPGYGLAESCVAVAFYPLEPEKISVDEEGYVVCGSPVPSMKLRIEGKHGEVLRYGEIGELCFQSPSQTLGYFRNRDATKALFTEDGFVRTGDIAKLDKDGSITIVDRKKNILILAGRTISPRELEEVVDEVEGVRTTMAVGLPCAHGGEEVHMVVETRVEGEHATALKRIVARTLRQKLAVPVAAVHLVAPGYIPKTYNGKLQYAVMRERLQMK